MRIAAATAPDAAMALLDVACRHPVRLLVNALGNAKARELVSYYVGQGVGLVGAVKSVAEVVQDFKTEFAEAYERFVGIMAD